MADVLQNTRGICYTECNVVLLVDAACIQAYQEIRSFNGLFILFNRMYPGPIIHIFTCCQLLLSSVMNSCGKGKKGTTTSGYLHLRYLVLCKKNDMQSARHRGKNSKLQFCLPFFSSLRDVYKINELFAF